MGAVSRRAAERMGLALQLCGLGYPGFVPADLASPPREAVAFVAKQVGVAAGTFARYAQEVDGCSRRCHVSAVVEQAGWRLCGPGEWKALGDSLTARALEHDTPSVLFRQALAQLRTDRVVRLGLDRVTGSVQRPGHRPRGESVGVSTHVSTPSCGSHIRLATTSAASGPAAAAPRPGRRHRRALGTTWSAWAARSSSATSRLRCSSPSSRLAPASTPWPRPCSSTASSWHSPRPALVHRRGLPSPHRPPAQPGRGPQRPPPLIFFANRGAVRSPHHDDQTTQAHCHTLVVNACVLSTTGYMEDAIDAEEADGHEVTTTPRPT